MSTLGRVADLRNAAKAGFDRLFEGVDSVVLTGLPDHANVGDSALSLGLMEYLSQSGIAVKSAHCLGTITSSVFSSSVAVVSNGGGNLGGLYAANNKQRYELARRLPRATPFILAPQSVAFVNKAARAEFDRAFASHKDVRVAVRDTRSAETIRSSFPGVVLMPDAVHVLGELPSPKPIRRMVVIARRDEESSGRTGEFMKGAVDWPEQPFVERVATSIRWKSSMLGPFKPALNPSVSGWERRLRSRLARGMQLVSEGEVVVTDRLHAMLLARQAGRRVVAVDNNNHKLSEYARTWLVGDPGLQFAEDLAHAVSLADRMGT